MKTNCHKKIEKTKCMIFYRHQKKIKPISFFINEVHIDNVSSFKFLAIMLNEHLIWKAHANVITIKLSKVVETIKVCLFESCSDDSVYITVLISHKLWTLAMGYRYNESISITKKK